MKTETALRRIDVETATLQVLKEKPAEEGIRTVARVRARLEAYTKIYKSFENFMITQAEAIVESESKLTNYERVSLARLVWDWIVTTEHFLSENENLLQEVPEQVRGRFTEQTFDGFPADIKERLIKDFNTMRTQMLIQFSEKIVAATREAEERKQSE